MSIRVILADDHRILREGLRSLLEKELRMEVVGQADNGRDAVELAKNLRPDIVVMDVHMPGLNGIEATRVIVRDCPGVRVVALSMHSDRGMVLETLRAGASGYLLKDCATDELERAIRTALSDRTYVSPDIAGVVVDELRAEGGAAHATPLASLTDRERQVLQLLAVGKTAKEIAATLGVSIQTIETHKQHLMTKLSLHGIAELTKFAVRHGITPLE
jgi:DNA-binding NarL/FixJ family response regulator